MDDWIVWEAGEAGKARCNFLLSTSLITPFALSVRGTRTSRMTRHKLGAEDFLCLGFARRGGGRFLLFLSTYRFGVNRRINENKANKQTNDTVSPFSRRWRTTSLALALIFVDD
jgi:hypothetical protein